MIKRYFSKKIKRRAQLYILQVVLALLLGVALAGVVILWQINKDETRRIELQNEARVTIPKPEIPPHTKNLGGPFALIDENGKAVTDAQFKGKYLLVYFGYTYCPDLCPTGLQSIAHALDQLGGDAKKVQTLYITIDPARDTPAKLKEYVASFHPDIIGLTGTADQIAAVAKEYQVYYKKGEQVDEKEYVMDHTSLIYLMGPEGQFILTFPENVDPKTIVNALKQQWTGNAGADKK